MYRINFIAVPSQLQPCPNNDDFFKAIATVNLGDLQATISDCTSEMADNNSSDVAIPQPPQKDARRGPRMKPALPFVMLRLWCLYPGLEAPPGLATLRKRLTKRGDDLGKQCGFIDGVPDRKTMRDRFKRLDGYPSLITEALLAISEASRAIVQPYLMPPPGPASPLGQDAPKNSKRKRDRTKECNDTRKRILEDGLGDEEFDELVPRGSGADNFLLRHLHGGQMTCHKCDPEQCKEHHSHGLKERRPRQLACFNPANHSDECVHEVRREWRCRCCGANVSTTAGVKLLHKMTVPLRMALRCLWIMVDSKCGISALRVGRRLNANGRTQRHGTILNLTHHIRMAMREPHPLPFEGKVEIDEAKIRLKDGVVHLIGAYDNATHRVYIEMMDGPANQEVFRAFVERVSRPGSRVDTDGTAAWPPDIDRIHGIVIHKTYDFGHAEELRGEGNGWSYITSNRIEGSWGLLRSALRIPGTVSCRHFPLYLDEVMWRINHSRNRLEAELHNGEERRVAVMMGQIVANMGSHRLLMGELREGDEAGSKRVAAGPVFSHKPVKSNCDLPDEVEMPGLHDGCGLPPLLPVSVPSPAIAADGEGLLETDEYVALPRARKLLPSQLSLF